MFDTEENLKGERRFRVASGRCRDLDNALSLVLALLIDPNLPIDVDLPPMLEPRSPVEEKNAPNQVADSAPLPRDSRPDSEQSANTEAAPQDYETTFAVVPVPVTPPKLLIQLRQRGHLAVPERRERYQFLVGAGIEIQPGLFMFAIPAPRLSVGARLLGVGALEIAIAFFTPQTKQVTGTEGEATMSILRTGLNVRPQIFSRGIFYLDAVVGCHVGVIWFTGRNFTQDHKGKNWLLDLPVGLSAMLSLSPRSNLLVDLGAAVYVKQEEINVGIEGSDETIPVHTTPRATFEAVIGLLVNL